MRPTILLFDLDGTLVSTEGAGRRAMEKAFGAVTGRADACAAFSFGGMTDRLIVRTGLRAIEHEDEDSTIDEVLESYLGFLSDELLRTQDLRELPGARAAVVAASRNDGVAVGLGTGNIRRGAALKLGRVGLGEAFAFGGFGCDHENRTELLRIGCVRGAAMLGRPLDTCRVVVIGDTPRDITAAQELGAACIAVATGSYRLEQLAALGADLVVKELTDPRCLEAMLEAG